MPFAQKYYYLPKQVFVRICSKARILPMEALQFVYCTTKGFDRNAGTLVQEIINCQTLELFENNARD